MATFFTRLMQANMSFETLPAFPEENWESPFFTLWLSTLLLLLASVVGLVVNGATVLIFLGRKKLRNLVNFVLLLDCVTHIILCLLCVPIHLAAAWVLPGRAVTKSWFILTILQQVVGNFANLVGLSLTLSIAILRYRRLCWKKKDRLSRANALKWSVTSGTIPTGFALVQSGSSIIFPSTTAAEPPIIIPALMIYIGKLVLIFFAILAVFFCYIRVAQRVWSSGCAAGGEEKVMDVTSKLKKSKSVHATMHSCIQMVLIVATLCPYLYEETMQTFHYSSNAMIRLSNVVSTTKNNEQGSTYYNSTSDRLWSITVNYILLILGTPLAYVASCHKYREQFVSFFSCRGGHSPDGAAGTTQVHHHDHEYRKALPSEIPIKSQVSTQKSFHVVSATSKFPEEIIITQTRKATSQSSLPTTATTTATSNSPGGLSSSWDSSKEGTQLSSSSLTSSSSSSSSSGTVPYIVTTTNRFPPVNITICMEKKNKKNKLAIVPIQHYRVRRDQDFGHKL